jgi:hypothetical protein
VPPFKRCKNDALVCKFPCCGYACQSQIHFPTGESCLCPLISETRLTVLINEPPLGRSTILLKLTNLLDLTLQVNADCLCDGDWELPNAINQLTHLTSLQIPDNFIGQTFTKPILTHYWNLILGRSTPSSVQRHRVTQLLCPLQRPDVCTQNFFEWLPSELCLKIFNHLRLREKMTIRTVCKEWHELVVMSLRHFVLSSRRRSSSPCLLSLLVNLSNLQHLQIRHVYLSTSHLSFVFQLLTKLTKLETLSISQTPTHLTSLQRLRKLEVDHLSVTSYPSSLTKLVVFETFNARLPTTLCSLHLAPQNFPLSRFGSDLRFLTKLKLSTGVWTSSINSFLFRFSQLRRLTLGPRPQFDDECPLVNSLGFLTVMTSLRSLELLLSFKSSSATYFPFVPQLTSLVVNQPRDFNFHHLTTFEGLRTFGFRLEKISNMNTVLLALQDTPHLGTLILLNPTDLNATKLTALEYFTQITSIIIDKKAILWIHQQQLRPYTRLRKLLSEIKIYKQKGEHFALE